MIKHIQEFLRKTLTSRKFWASVAASAPFALAGDFENFALVWMAYAGIQGAVDASEGVGTKRAVEALTAPPQAPESQAPRLSPEQVESLSGDPDASDDNPS
jgi:hypothetical protein